MQENQIPQGESAEESKANSVESLSPEGQSRNVDGLVRKKDELLAANSRLKDKLKAYEERERLSEQKSLEEKGQYQELIEQLRDNESRMKSEFTEMQANFLNTVLDTEIKARAASKGMISPEDAMSMVGKDGLGDIVDKSTFKVNSQGVEEMLENLKKNKPYLFKTSQTKMRDGVPVPSPEAQGGAPKKDPAENYDDWHKRMAQAISKER